MADDGTTSSDMPIAPVELILPNQGTTNAKGNTSIAGDVILSGGKICFCTGTTWEVVTSAKI